MQGRKLTAKQLRELIRSGRWDGQTSGAAHGYVQANLVMLPDQDAFDFLLFCTRNHKPCPILDVLEPGEVAPAIAKDADVRTDLPKYRVYRHGKLDSEMTGVSSLFNEHIVTFLLGCSFSFEKALQANRVPVRNIDQGKNVSMYETSIPCRPAGKFGCNMVVSMRPMKPEDAIRAVQVTTRFHLTHGAPVHMGEPEHIGIKDLNQPDYGDAVTMNAEDIPVFWACGVTSSLAALSAGLPLVITHAPGHMFVSDLADEDMTVF